VNRLTASAAIRVIVNIFIIVSMSGCEFRERSAPSWRSSIQDSATQQNHGLVMSEKILRGARNIRHRAANAARDR
jgi:hypothetical protein